MMSIGRHAYLKPRQAVLFRHFKPHSFSRPQPVPQVRLLEDFTVSLKPGATPTNHLIY